MEEGEGEQELNHHKLREPTDILDVKGKGRQERKEEEIVGGEE